MDPSNSDLGSHRLSSLRWEITAVVAAIAVIILTVAVIVATTLRGQTIDNAHRELAAVSKVTAERTLQTLSAADILTRSIQDLAIKPPVADSDALRERATTRSFYESLVALQKLLPQIDGAAVVAADGQILANSRQYPAPNLNMSQARFFLAVKTRPEGGFAISQPVKNPLTGQWMIYLARSLTDAQGRFIGIALAGIQSRYFEGYFASIDVGPTSSVLLTDWNSVVVARWPHLENVVGTQLPDAHPEENPKNGETMTDIVIGLDHVVRLVAITAFEVQGTPLLVTVGQSRSAVLEPWRNMLIWIGLFAGTSLLVLAALTWLVWRAVGDEVRWSRTLVERETRLSQQAIELAAARDQAERANRVRGEFLANMSHELRTPLNAVLGFSEVIERELFGPLGDARYKECALDIHRSGKHLLDIIGAILDLTKIDAGRLDLHEEEVDIVDLMRATMRLMIDAARAGGVRLEMKIPEMPVLIQADRTRMRQILLNLLSNAVKFTPAGRDVVMSGSVAEDGFVIRIKDTGIGMTPTDAALAMQPFRQIDNSLSRKYEGTGLGLPLTKSLVELHSGTMEIDSALGVGTTVIVRLPRWRLLPPAETAAA